MSPLGRYVIRARKQRGWTRAELARSANVPYTTLRNIEASKQNVHTSELALRALADALGENAEARDEMYEIMRVLAGYLIVASKDASERDQRLLANIDAYPELRRSLETLFDRGDVEDIDRANTALEVARGMGGKHPKGHQ